MFEQVRLKQRPWAALWNGARRNWRRAALLAGLVAAATPVAQAQVLVDGRVDAAEIGTAATGKYVLLGTFSPAHVSNMGFGNWGLLRLYAANTATKVYFAVVGTPENNGNTLQLYLDLPNLTNGVTMGNPLPGGTANSNTSFDFAQPKMDMNTDLGIALQGNGSSYGPQVMVYNGNATPGSDLALSTGVPTTGAFVTMSAAQTTGVYSRFAGMRMAFLNTSSGDITTNPGNYGWEVELDRAALGSTTNGSLMRVMAAYVNGDGSYFSSDVIPEVTGNGNNNLATNPDFTALPGTQAATFALAGTTTNSTQALNYNTGGAQVLAGAYTDLGTSGTAIATANRDNANSAPQNIGFNFQYDGLSFSQFVLNTNGFLKLGAGAPSTAALYLDGPQLSTGGPFNSTSAADVDLLMPFNHNLVDGPVSAEYRVATTGTAPNRVCTIQWKNVSDIQVDATGKQFNALQFQAKLYETSNVIDFVYGSATPGPGPDAFKYGAVGLKGMGGNTDQLLTVTKVSSQAWSAAVVQSGNYTGAAFNFRSTVPPVVGVTYRFRPSLAADAGVQEIYSLGKLPVPFGTPHAAQAVVYNYGTSTLTNTSVSLAVMGATSFANTKTIASLAPGASAKVTFDAYTPAATGVNTLTVTLGNDDNLANNTATLQQTVTANTFAYAEPGTATYTSAGFGTGSGIIAAKYTTNTVRTVKAVNVYLDGQSSVGNVVYGTVLNNQGTLLGRTPNYVVQAADLGTLKTFTFSVPVTVLAGEFLVGLAQTAGTVAYFPVGFQAETPTRQNAFFATAITGGALNDIATSNTTLGRPVIEAVVNVVILSTSVASVCSSPNTGTLTLSDFGGTVSRYQANTGTGFQDLAGTSATFTFSNLTATTTFRAVTTTSTNQTIFSTPVTVTVLPRPAATLAASSPVSFCGQGTLTLNAAQTAGATYQFLLNGAPIAGATTASYSTTVSSSGTYTVQVTSANGCGSTSGPINVTVNPLPTPALSAGTATTFCQGGSVVLTASGGASGATYQFFLNGATLTGATASAYTASAGGNYTATVTNPTGCAATSAPVAVTVNPATSAAFAYSAATYCQSGTAPTPTVTGTAGGTFSAGTGLSINVASGLLNLAASALGSYTVQYSVGGPCPSSSTAAISITAAPVAAFGYAAPAYCVSAAGTAAAVLATGSTAGTFSATPAGLSLNAASGVITPSASQAGNYTVTNSIAAANGCAATSATATVRIEAAPVASLSAGGATTFCQGSSVVLTATGGSSYQFLLNGQPVAGTTATTYTAAAAGSYSVIVTNAAGCTATSAPVTIVVNPQTTATFSYAAASYCVSGTNPVPSVTGTAGGAFSAGAGLAINAATGALALATSTPSTYTVTYSVGGSCPSSTTTTVVINAAPTAGFSYTAPSYCVSATATATPVLTGTSGIFSAPSGLTINAATGVVTPSTSTPSTYTVTNTVAAANGCAAVTATAQVVIAPAPVVTVSAAGPTTFCQGNSVVLTATGGGSYLWSNGATTAAITVTAAGSYSVTATSAAGCTATSSATTVTVNPATTATFAYAASTFCQSGPNPTPTVTGTAGGTFSATTGLTVNVTTGAVNLAASTAGTYTVTYAVGGTCPSTSTTTVTITTAPLATFSYASASYCAGATASPTPAAATGAALGTFSSTTGLVLNATTGAINLATSTASTYTVTNNVAAANGCAAATATFSVTINAAPVRPIVSVQYNGPTTTLTSSAATGNQWYQNGQPVTGATAQTYVVNSAAQLGSYTVVVTNASGCSSLPSQALVVTATAQPLAGTDVRVFPNPTTDGQLTLELRGYRAAVQLSVLDATGRVVFLQALAPAGSSQQTLPLNLAHLPTGLYVLRVQTEGGTATRRIVRE